jgi:hypothetical protein
MSDNDALNGHSENARVDARFLELLAHYYDASELIDWIAQGEAGKIKLRSGQLDRWRDTLRWLRQAEEQEQERVNDET